MLDQGVEWRKGSEVHDRRKIIIRAVVAAGLIAVLLASLLMFEQQKPQDDEVSSPPVSSPNIGIAVSSGTNSLPEDVQAAIKDAPDMTETELASMSAPVGSPVATLIAPIVAEGSKDPSVTSALGAPTPTAVVKADPRTGKSAHSDRLVVEAPKLTPATAAPVSVPTKPSVIPSTVAPAGGIVVQLGVFSNSTNAEELRAKLKQAGIPSQLETRVQVGPFNSKEEAIKVQEKLRSLGLGGGMLVLPKKP